MRPMWHFRRFVDGPTGPVDKTLIRKSMGYSDNLVSHQLFHWSNPLCEPTVVPGDAINAPRGSKLRRSFFSGRCCLHRSFFSARCCLGPGSSYCAAASMATAAGTRDGSRFVSLPPLAA